MIQNCSCNLAPTLNFEEREREMNNKTRKKKTVSPHVYSNYHSEL